MPAEYVSAKVTQIGSHVLLNLDFPLPDPVIAHLFYDILTLSLEANQNLLANGLPVDISGLKEFIEGVFGEVTEETSGAVQVLGIHKFSPDKRTKSRYKRVASDDRGDGQPSSEADRDGSQVDDPVGRQE